MFVRDTLTATHIPAFKNYFEKAKESHRHNTCTLKDTVEILQPTTETYGRYSIRFQPFSLRTEYYQFSLTCIQTNLAGSQPLNNKGKIMINVFIYFFHRFINVEKVCIVCKYSI